MGVTFKAVTYPEARTEFFEKKHKSAMRALNRHVQKMADDSVNAFDFEAQDKASNLGWNAAFCADACRVFNSEWMHDFGTVCLCAVRYSLGRMTYMPSLVQDFIRKNIDMLHSGTIDIMVRDIKEHGSNVCGENPYGADFDYRGWMSFVVFLQGEAEKRKAVGHGE